MKQVWGPRALAALVGTVILTAAMVACGGGHAAGATTEAQVPSTASPVAARPAYVTPGDWSTFDYDAQRAGVGPSSTGITARNLGALRTRVVGLSGVADSPAVELHGVVAGGHKRDLIFTTTTYGRTLAIDPATGHTLWQYAPGDIGSYRGSAQITTATPVIDPDRLYVYAASPDGFVHKLSVSTGREVRFGHWPVRVTFSPVREKIGASLNVSGRSVVVVTGGYFGDQPPYQGHVVMIDRASGRITHVWNSLCSNRHYLIDRPGSCPASDSAIWARAGAVIEPGTGRILVATGNGPFNGSTDWGDSVIELSPDAARPLHNWTPLDEARLNATDTDLGSTAPALLPAVDGYRLAVQGGKDGLLHLLNLNRLDGTAGGAGSRLGGEVSEISSPGGGEVLTAPAVWSHARREYVFVGDDSGTAAYALRLGARPHLATLWQNGRSGTSPVLAGGLLYVYDDHGAALDVYNPISGRLLRSLPAAPGHWSSPIVIGGRIILPTGGSTADNAPSSQLFIYHLPGK
jgi:outer membrane protein assembly factor BamB